jgi:hypothetical protein
LVITLAPPDLPLPFDEIDILILKQFLPIAMPLFGFSFSTATNCISSFLKKDIF